MRFDDRVTGVLDKYAKQAKIIHLDIDKSEFNKNVKCDVTVLGDCKQTLAMITSRINKNSHTEWIKSFEPYKQEEYDKVIEPALFPTEGPLKMGEVVNAVSERAADNAVLVTDVGQNQMFSSRYFKYNNPRSIITSGGLGTMGFGLPAAMGATFGAPERPIILFTGDGGLQMNIQELGTIMQSDIPVKIVLLNNNYLGNVRQWQELFFNRRYSCTVMANPDYMKIAEAYGINSRRVTEREELGEAINEMLNSKGAYILEIGCQNEENVWPMVALGCAVDEVRLG
jgi:acetolactate synthase-1/2/3 large subunit